MFISSVNLPGSLIIWRASWSFFPPKQNPPARSKRCGSIGITAHATFNAPSPICDSSSPPCIRTLVPWAPCAANAKSAMYPKSTILPSIANRAIVSGMSACSTATSIATTMSSPPAKSSMCPPMLKKFSMIVGNSSWSKWASEKN